MQTPVARLGGTAFAVAVGLFETGCPGEFSGLLDPLDAGASDAGADEPSTHNVPTYDAAASDAAAPDSAAAARDASADAMSGDAGASPDGASATDAGSDASSTEAGCGATDTTGSCGACGQACDSVSGAPSCDGKTCSYVCNAGNVDCNAAVAPDTDGCECATPACCGNSCQTIHDNGVGQAYYDCNPLGVYGAMAAMAACTAFANGDPSKCSDKWYCDVAERQVCYVAGPNTCQTYCWTYSGASAGTVSDCTCPAKAIASWQ